MNNFNEQTLISLSSLEILGIGYNPVFYIQQNVDLKGEV